jgi:hypothetical protein
MMPKERQMRMVTLLLMFSFLHVGSADAIRYGKEDSADEYAYVLQLYMQDVNCSAVLVKPKIIVTAAHCFFYKKSQSRIETLHTLRNGKVRKYPGDLVKSVVMPPEIVEFFQSGKEYKDMSNNLRNYDFAVIVLKDALDLPLPRTILDNLSLEYLASHVNDYKRVHSDEALEYYRNSAWLPLVEHAFPDGKSRDDAVIAVGFGRDAEGQQDGKRYSSKGYLVSIERCGLWPNWAPNIYFWWCAAVSTQAGDSGGPILIQTSTGQYLVAGILTFGWGNKPAETFVSLFGVAYYIHKANSASRP